MSRGLLLNIRRAAGFHFANIRIATIKVSYLQSGWYWVILSLIEALNNNMEH